MSNTKLDNIRDSLVQNIINNINTLMKQKSISTNEIEKNVGRDNLRLLLIGKIKTPNVIMIYEIAQKLGVTIQELLQDPADKINFSIYIKSSLIIIEENIKQLFSNMQRTRLEFLTHNMVQNIKILMNQQSLSIYEMEKTIGSRNVADLLNGIRKTTSINIMYKIAQILQVNIEELLQTPINSDNSNQKNINKDLESNLFNIEEKTKALLIDIQKLKKEF